MVPLPAGRGGAEPGRPDNTVKGGLLQAGPVAIAGMLVNGAAALVVVAVARLVTSQAYGEIAQLLGLFFILSMPGSAVLVGVVRRVTGLRTTGQSRLVRRWVARVHRILLVAIGVELVLVLAAAGLDRPPAAPARRPRRGPDPHGRRHLDPPERRPGPPPGPPQLPAAGRQPAGRGRRPHRPRARAGGAPVPAWPATHSASSSARWWPRSTPAGWPAGRGPTRPAPPWPGTGWPPTGGAEEILARRKLIADVSAAFVGLALLGLLQNVDVILLGRLDHHTVGPYAAISVASKALVFGALALGAYLLPEATIRRNEGGHAIRQLGVTLLFLSVPAALLLGIAVFVPRQFLTLIFSARLATAAPAFAPLVLAMLCLSFTVLVTNYLFGTGSRGSSCCWRPGRPWPSCWSPGPTATRRPRPGPTSWSRRSSPWAWGWPSWPSTSVTGASTGRDASAGSGRRAGR